MTGNRSKLKNFVEKFIGTVRFGNDHFGAIMGYGDYVIVTSISPKEICVVNGESRAINGKKYILVIMDDYSRFTWVKFLRSKDETPEFVINFLKQIQVGLNKTVRYIRTDNGTEFVNQVMSEYYEDVGIFHQKFVPRNSSTIRRICRKEKLYIVEARSTMLIFSKARCFYGQSIATACLHQETDPYFHSSQQNPL
ncbi:retrovirus-related pol polyprotein from transposon TNT 1-94 [Tanacetum coccineum]